MPIASTYPFVLLPVPPFVNRNSEQADLSCLTGISPFVTDCNNCLVAVHAHTHIHMTNDARRILSLTSLSYTGFIPHQQISPCTIHQHRYALRHKPYFLPYAIIRFQLIFLTIAYEWLASVCRDDGFQLATICRLLSVRLFRIAIIEATHFSDANLA